MQVRKDMDKHVFSKKKKNSLSLKRLFYDLRWRVGNVYGVSLRKQVNIFRFTYDVTSCHLRKQLAI